MKPEAAKRQAQLTDRIVREISAAGLGGMIEQVVREQSEKGQRALPPPSREHEILTVCKLSGYARLAEGFVAEKLDLDIVRARLARLRCEQDEEIGSIRARRRADVSEVVNTADDAKRALDEAIENINAQVEQQA
jgi:hypothetical protein